MFDILCRRHAASGPLAATAKSVLSSAALTSLFLGSLSASAQGFHRRQSTVIIPHASQSSPEDKGIRAHANVRILMTPTAGANPQTPPFAGYGYETPATLACIYGLAHPTKGCNPNEVNANSTGGSGAIAIVDAYDYPTAQFDLSYFSQQFGLPAADLTVVYAQGTEPPADPTGGWEFEEALDIEYAHAMAPNAKIYLVEANSNYNSDLYPAITVATNLVRCGKTTTCPSTSTGKGEVSMSWGGSEFTGETQLDSYFSAPGVTFVAAAGDEAGVIYPCASPNVVCAGGTSTARSDTTGNLIGEIAWSDAGGGVSEVEPIPSYQAHAPLVAFQTGKFRGVPDISAVANPNTGVWVIDTTPYEGSIGWWTVGGTSLATPVLSGVLNATKTFGSSAEVLADVYDIRNKGAFNDILYGACGYYSGSFSGLGWDLCTGQGSPANFTKLTSSSKSNSTPPWFW